MPISFKTRLILLRLLLVSVPYKPFRKLKATLKEQDSDE